MAPNILNDIAPLYGSGGLPIDDPIALIFDGIARGDVSYLAGAFLVLLTYVVRPLATRYHPDFGTDRGGALLVTLLGGFLGLTHGLVVSLRDGVVFDSTMIAAILRADIKVVIAAVGWYTLVRKGLRGPTEKEAEKETTATVPPSDTPQ